MPRNRPSWRKTTRLDLAESGSRSGRASAKQKAGLVAASSDKFDRDIGRRLSV
jgi:hypothetical protein